MLNTFDQWKCSPPSYEEDPRCDCEDPAHEGPCRLCDLCPCGCGSVGAAPCLTDDELCRMLDDMYGEELEVIGHADTIPASRVA